jgi:2,4-dienoyl-CoA reductase-like NADH-dependent reductase (Old Yellow Enzyme family)
MQHVRCEVGDEFPVLVKLNLNDGFAGGWSVEDCKYMLRELEKVNCTAVMLSGGFTSRTPFYLLRGDVPLKGMIRNGSSLAEKITMSLFGPWLVKKYAFNQNFFLNQAKEIRCTTKMPLVYLGGVDSMAAIEEVIRAGFDFIAIGRALIHDPDFLIKLESGQVTKSGCTHCNECIVEMDRGGVKCVMNNQ